MHVFCPFSSSLCRLPLSPPPSLCRNALNKLILSPGLLMIWLTGLSLLVVLLWRKNVNNPSAKMSKYPPGPRLGIAIHKLPASLVLDDEMIIATDLNQLGNYY